MQGGDIFRLEGVDLSLVKTEERPCPYLEGQRSSELAALSRNMSPVAYQDLMDRGFRRSGSVFYRPDCASCHSCQPIRVPVDTFTPSRSQRRVRQRNVGVRIAIGSPRLDEERLALYHRYLSARHARKEACTADEYSEFFLTSPLDTLEMSYYCEQRLLGVGLVDLCPGSLSSVYFYFDPDWSKDSPGVFSGLCEIELCRALKLPFWYLGFFVRDCRSMEYKARFRPCEILGEDGVWKPPAAPLS
ncbi:MAG: arginyltransferase [Planctomycetes bacterium]|nr:arginyltransferase [Planctomycetota bacterium]